MEIIFKELRKSPFCIQTLKLIYLVILFRMCSQTLPENNLYKKSILQLAKHLSWVFATVGLQPEAIFETHL